MAVYNYYIYILTNKNNTVLYTGVTRDLFFAWDNTDREQAVSLPGNIPHTNWFIMSIFPVLQPPLPEKSRSRQDQERKKLNWLSR